MASNPLLESLGNAVTLRNDNSSRFGKYVKIIVDKETSTQLISAHIDVFLLERSRVTGVQPNEANFHFLYQVQQTEPCLAQHSFRWLNNGGVQPATASQYSRTLESLKTIGATSDEIETMRKVAAAILWLGELIFEPQGDGSKVSARSEAALGWVALYLGVTVQDVMQSCCFETLDTRKGGTMLARPLPPVKAGLQRDSLARALYAALFTWAVAKVNASLSSDNDVGIVAPEKSTLSIGVLDIFGFEIMPVNHLEQVWVGFFVCVLILQPPTQPQFLINFANERLHCLFLDAVLKAEQAIYVAEGLNWSAISYKNNDSLVSHLGNVVLVRKEEEAKNPHTQRANTSSHHLHVSLLFLLASFR